MIARLRKLIETGIQTGDSSTIKRGIILSNCIALIFITVSALIFIIIPQNHNWGGLSESLFGMAAFSIPILLNRARLLMLSRLLLCWLPPVLVFWIMILGMQGVDKVPYSSYNGLRIYLLAAGCIPFLVLERKPFIQFLLGVLPSLLGLIFLDVWLDLFHVGYFQKGIPDTGHWFAPTRSIIAYTVIGGSCFTLRFIVDRTDKRNQKLIEELEKSNRIIKQQAESELKQINIQLIEKIKELSKREFVLQQSQTIAKVGSWEYSLVDRSVYWSDQMYEIFGIDKNFDLQDPALTTYLFGEYAPFFNNATQELTTTGKAYDLTLQTKTPLGYLKWVRVAGFPHIENGRVMSVSGIVHDITLFKESELLIRTSEKSYRSLFEQASDAIMISDFKGNFTDVNENSCKMLGYEKTELLQLNISNLMDPEQLKTSPIRFDLLAIGQQVFTERKLLHKNGSIIHMEVNVKKIGDDRIMAIARDVTRRIQAEREKEKIRYDLNERVKELTTLYKVSQILQIDQTPMHETLQQVVSVMPSAWQYPETAAARITIAGMEFITPNYNAYKHQQLSEFNTRNGLTGTIEVVYLDERPNEAEGPFFTEERDLLNMLANMIQIYLNRRYETEALRRSEANQSATINNSNYMIWSVNREYELTSFNKLFSEFFENRFGVKVTLGVRFIDGTPQLHEMRERWLNRYNRALSGEAFKIQTDIDDHQIEFSLNPIIEASQIIGVTVFGEDITDRLRREKEIQDANKLIGELQLMALRSVMNPHFIFNSLNSIQYYILENDTKSAVTYLSTFSKLIRAILSNSVKNKVRLAEEIDMLKLYINMESMRFDHKFDSIITISEDVDVENVEIPSMLVQPYVENSIIHGLYNKKAHGILKIGVSLQNGMLLFEIEDDGVGRKASEQLKAISMSKHKSMGTALTEERLRLINREGQATVETIDLENEGKSAGTKVNIWVKYQGL